MLSGCGKDDSEIMTPPPTTEPTATLSPEPTAMPTPEPKRETHRSGDFTYVLLDNQTVEITGYDGVGDELTIPSSLDGYAVTSIGDYAFRQAHFSSVAIPDSISDIGANPFFDCHKLSSIVVSPDHPALAIIDGVLFSKADKRLVCYPLTFTEEEYSIPQGIQVIGDRAFCFCDSLSYVTIPNSITSIGDAAFHACSSLTSITIPDSVTSIGINPFSLCKVLSNIVVSPENTVLETIDGVLFSKPDKRLVWYPITFTAEEYSIPQGIQVIDKLAFSWCRLSSVTIPDGLTSIKDGAFYFCSLSRVTIPDSVTSIGDEAFRPFEPTITVGRDSYAKQYCVDNGLNYIYFDQNDWLNK